MALVTQLASGCLVRMLGLKVAYHNHFEGKGNIQHWQNPS
jgi:hypothetical protein